MLVKSDSCKHLSSHAYTSWFFSFSLSLFLKINYAKQLKDTVYLIDAIQDRAVWYTILYSYKGYRTSFPRLELSQQEHQLSVPMAN